MDSISNNTYHPIRHSWAVRLASIADEAQRSSLLQYLYLSPLLYSAFILSVTLYVLPNLPLHLVEPAFSSINGLDLMKLLSTPLVLWLTLHSSWVGTSTTIWFGHLVFSYYQFHVTYLLFLFFWTYIVSLLAVTHYSNTALYDYTLTLFNFFLWVWFLFYASNVFTLVFFLEVLGALVTLILITSTFSSTHFYNNAVYSSHTYFQTSTPTPFLQTLMFFFWITLVSSLALFLLVINFYHNFLTFNWNLVTSVLSFLLIVSSTKTLLLLSFTWLLFFTCVFIKCGLVPLYLWKPAFFKGMSFLTLFFYVYVYYFALFFYVLYVVYFYLNELFVFNAYLLTWLLVISTLYLTSILLESYYVKSFLALSSILNSTLVLYALCGSHAVDTLLTL